MNRTHLIGIVLALTVCFGVWLVFFQPSQNLHLPAGDESENQHDLFLQVSLKDTEAERAAFVEEFSQRRGFVLRDLYEKWIDVIGANGIIYEVEAMYPTCHDRGHDLGKVIYAKIGNIGEALRTCDDSCYSGCMHGVMMEAFSIDGTAIPGVDMGEWESGAHAEITDIESKMNEMCREEVFAEGEDYSAGDCAHGVGHALMFISDYSLEEATDLCGGFDSEIMDYYCATGAYMEYVGNNPSALDASADIHDVSPCDTASYPAACFRYKMVDVRYEHYAAGGTLGELRAVCDQFEGNVRLGCMHGFGNAHTQLLVQGALSLQDVCMRGSDDEQYVCIEGAMERMARYHPVEALQICLEVPEGWQKELCREAIHNELYSLDKPFDYYLK